MSFGYSAGDILSGGRIAHDVIKLLANPKNASKEYQEAYVELLAMTEVFNQAIMVLRDQFIPKDVKNAIAHIALSSIDTIEKFKVNAERYHREFMTKNKFGMAQTKWTQMGWAVFKRSELTTLVTQLRAQVSAIEKLKSFFPSMESPQMPRNIALYNGSSMNKAQDTDVSSLRAVHNVHPRAESLKKAQVSTTAPDSAVEPINAKPPRDIAGDTTELKSSTTDSLRALSVASRSIKTRNELDSDTLVKRIVTEMRQAEQDAIRAAEAETPKPIRFKDAVGRKYSFPFEVSRTWTGIDELIKQAFLHVDVVGPHVQAGHFDLLGPDQDIILPQLWDRVIKPDTAITMVMWPMSKPAHNAGPGQHPGLSRPPPPPGMFGGQGRPMGGPPAPVLPVLPVPPVPPPRPTPFSYPTSQSSHSTDTSSDTGRSDSSSGSDESPDSSAAVPSQDAKNSDVDESGSDGTEHDEDSELMKACLRGDLEDVERILHSGAEIDATNSQGATALHIASGEGHLRIIRALLKHGADVSDEDHMGETPAFDAVRSGHLKTLKLLLRKGSDISLENNDGNTALQVAITEGQDAVAEFLISESNEENPDILTTAVKWGQVNIVKLLLEKGYSPRKANRAGSSALDVACGENMLEILELLLDNDLDTLETCRNFSSHLEQAIIFNREAAVELLLRRGMNVKDTDDVGDTASRVACQDNHQSVTKNDDDDDDERQDALLFTIHKTSHMGIVKLLLDSGANPMVANASGKTAMHYAAERGLIAIIKLLTANGASQTMPDGLGRLPIHLASQNGYVETVEYFLERGVDVTLADNDGNTAFLLAVQNRHLEIFRLLMCKISDILAPNHENYTTLHAVAEQGNLELLRFIAARSAKADATDASGTTPLHIASRDGYVYSVKYLLGCGVENSVPNIHGATPLHLASQNGHAEVVDLLLSHGASLTVTDHNNKTPLDVALQKDQLAVVKVLLQKRQWLI